MRNITRVVLMILITTALVTITAINCAAQKARANTVAVTPVQQPLISEYKSIRLGMTADAVRAKLGTPTLKADDQDYYVFSENESAQFAYDATHKVVTISIDYTGAGAPDYHGVVGPPVEERPDGSLYKIVRYEAQRFWVSYSRMTSGVVTITIQKIY